VDAATGEFERGYVRVADMVTRQPWRTTCPSIWSPNAPSVKLFDNSGFFAQFHTRRMTWLIRRSPDLFVRVIVWADWFRIGLLILNFVVRVR